MFGKMFWICFWLVLAGSQVQGQESRIMPELKFLGESSILPQKLTIEQDSVRFLVSGKVPMESVLTPRNPRVKLFFISPDQTLDLGNIDLVKNVSHYKYEQRFKLPFEPWMENGFLEIRFFQGRKDEANPEEKKILARGILAPQRMVRIGEALPGENIQPLGMYILTQKNIQEEFQEAEFTFFFGAGSSSLRSYPANAMVLEKMDQFFLDYPQEISLKVTGIHSPEDVEISKSDLSTNRAKEVKENLLSRFVNLKESMITLDSRTKDFFDLRILLRDFTGISDQRKEELYAILLSREDFISQKERLEKIPGSSQIKKDLYPKLRAVRVQVTGKASGGLTYQQSKKLKEALESNSGENRLSFIEWNQAAEFTPNLEEKAAIYAKMTEYYRSPIPYNNLAVIRMRQAQRILDGQSKELLWEEALRLLTIAYRIEPNPEALFNQGQILALQGLDWEAYQKLSQASTLTQNPEFVSKNEALRGALDLRRGDYKLATLRFEKPTKDPLVLFNKGLAYFLLEDYSKANAAFEESVNQGREIGYGYYGLAMVAASNGLAEEALIHLQKVGMTNPFLKSKIVNDPIFQELREMADFFEVFSN